MCSHRPGWLLALLLATSISACRAQANLETPSKGPDKEAPPVPRDQATGGDLASLEQQLDSEEVALFEQLQAMATTRNEAGTLGTGAVESPAQTAEPLAEQPASPPPPRSARRETRPAPPGPTCGQACRSLASMQRAADGICRLAGEEQERCARARQRVQLAEQRVLLAGCQCTEQHSP